MLIFKISSHGSDLAVPEVQFLFRSSFLLDEHVDLLLKTLIIGHLSRKPSLQVIDFISEHFSVCIESSFKINGTFLVFAGLHGSSVNLLLLILNLFFLNHFLFYPLLLTLFENIKLVLSLFQNFLRLSEVLSECGILERKFINFHFHGIILCGSHVTIFISLKDIDLSLELVILLVEEINLILQFGDTLLILLILIFKVDFFQVLSWSIHIVKSKNLIIAHFQFLNQIFGVILLFYKFLLDFLKHLNVLFAPLIGFPNFRSPLVLVNENGLLNAMSLLRGIWTALHKLRFLKCTRNFHVLLEASNQILAISFIESAQTIHNFILAWHIDLLQGFLHLSLQPNHLQILLFHSLIFGFNQEF